MSRYIGSFIYKEKISSVQHSHQVLYYLTSQVSINHSTILCSSEHFTNPTQYLFLDMSPSTNTHSSLTTFTELTETSPSNSYYVTQNDFSTTTKYQLSNFDDKFKESLKEIIADQDAKLYGLIETIFRACDSRSKRIAQIYFSKNG